MSARLTECVIAKGVKCLSEADLIKYAQEWIKDMHIYGRV